MFRRFSEIVSRVRIFKSFNTDLHGIKGSTTIQSSDLQQKVLY